MSQNNSNHALLIEISFIILTVGLILEVSLEGEEAKLRVFGNYVKSDFGSFITQAELAQNEQALANANLAFNIELQKKDGFFANVVNQCIFTTDVDINVSCIVCELKDDQVPPNIVGRGKLDTPMGVKSGVTNTVLIDEVPPDVQNVHKVKLGLCSAFLVLDEDAIDNGIAPNFFLSSEINDDIAAIGLRLPLPAFSGANIGTTIQLSTGNVGDEGWYVLEKIPQSWIDAGPINIGLPTDIGIGNYLVPGPGLGTPDANGNRETLLDKIDNLNPLRAHGLEQLVGRDVCAAVRNSSISISHNPLLGSLKGDYLGVVAFHVISFEVLSGTTGFSADVLPEATIEILDSDIICGQGLFVLDTFPVHTSSSEPFDVDPNIPLP